MKNIESVVKFHDENFPTSCDHTTNLLSSLNVFKGFQNYFSRYWEKDDRNNGKKWEIISGL